MTVRRFEWWAKVKGARTRFGMGLVYGPDLGPCGAARAVRRRLAFELGDS
jgi:hypothetical protein